MSDIAARVHQPIPLDVAVKIVGNINGANTTSEATVTRRGGGQVSDSTKMAMGHRGTTP